MLWTRPLVLLTSTGLLSFGPSGNDMPTHNVFAVRELYNQVCELHLAVAQRSVMDEADKTLDDHTVVAPRTTREFHVVFKTDAWDGSMPCKFSSEYGNIWECHLAPDRHLVEGQDQNCQCWLHTMGPSVH